MACVRSFVASRIGETQLYLQRFLVRSAAGKQAAGGGNTQVDLPGSTALADIRVRTRYVRFTPEN
jgi:hypothetical protein